MDKKNIEVLTRKARRPNMTDLLSLMLIREMLDVPRSIATPSGELQPTLIECNAQSLIDNNVSISNNMQGNKKEAHIGEAMRGVARSWVVECKIKIINNDE